MNVPASPRSPGELYTLLALQVEAYHKHRRISSTSVSTETARELLESIQYTLTKGNTLFLGQEVLRRQLEECRSLLKLVFATAPTRGNDAWHDTCFTLGNYLNAYDTEFFAHRTPLFLDYPLLRDVSSASGIDCAEAYLRCLWQENQILSCFDPQRLERLYFAVDPDFHSIPLNLCEQPLYNALGRAVLGLSPLELTFTQEDAAATAAVLLPMPEAALSAVLASAMDAVLSAMALPDPAAARYAALVLPSVAARLGALPHTGSPVRLFLPFS